MAKAHAAHTGPGTIETLAHRVLAPRAEEIAAAASQQAKLLLLDAIALPAEWSLYGGAVRSKSEIFLG